MARPAAPVLKGKAISIGRIRLTWEAVEGATSYDLYRANARQAASTRGNEVQKVAVQATGGTYTLSFDGDTTAALDFDLTAAELEAELNALVVSPEITVTVSRTTVAGGFEYLVTYAGALGGTNVASMTADSTNLTGGTHTATISTPTSGGPFDDAVTSPYIDSVSADTRYAYALRARNTDGASEVSNILLFTNQSIEDSTDGTPVPAAIRSALGSQNSRTR